MILMVRVMIRIMTCLEDFEDGGNDNNDEFSRGC